MAKYSSTENLNIENMIEYVSDVTYTEIWKYIEGYEGIYSISSFGRVKSHLRKRSKFGKDRILKQAVNRIGYCIISLSKDKIKTYKIVHRLVATNFIDNPLNKREVNHLFGNKEDNRFFRIEWITRSDNQKHAFRIGLKKRYSGEESFVAKLDWTIIKIMRDKFIKGEKVVNICSEYNMSASHVMQICKNMYWHDEKYMWEDALKKRKRSKVSPEVSEYIKSELRKNVKMKDIIKIVKMDAEVVRKVKNGTYTVHGYD